MKLRGILLLLGLGCIVFSGTSQTHKLTPEEIRARMREPQSIPQDTVASLPMTGSSSATASSRAQDKITFVSGSFKKILTPTSTTLSQDAKRLGMRWEDIVWPVDGSGSKSTALIILEFENFAPSDIDKLSTKVSGQRMVVSQSARIQDNKKTLWLFVQDGPQTVDLDFNHPFLGTARIPGVNLERGNVYVATLRENGLHDVEILSDPAGATVVFDGREVGMTPLTLSSVELGHHSMSLQRITGNDVVQVGEHMVNVTTSNYTFQYQMHPKKSVRLVTNPAGASISVYSGSDMIATGVGSVELKEVPYGKYRIIGTDKGEVTETELEVNVNTPSTKTIRIAATRRIILRATQNGYEVRGAKVNINGLYSGVTPLETNLEFGEYSIEIDNNGCSKTQKITVGPANSREVTLKLPKPKTYRPNIFKRYERREWGIAVNYVNRGFQLSNNSDGAQPLKAGTTVNSIGSEGASSGFQIGIVYEPYFGAGQGLSTGLFYQGFFDSYDYSEHETFHLQDDQLYIPLQYQIRVPFSRDCSVFVNAGVGLNIGLSHKMKSPDSYYTSNYGYYDGGDVNFGYGYNDETRQYYPDAFQGQWLFGGGIQLKAFQIDFKYGIGMSSNSAFADQTAGSSFGNNSARCMTWSLGASLIF